MKLGFSKTAAKQIIRESKALAIGRYEEYRKTSNNMIKLKRSPFDNRRLD